METKNSASLVLLLLVIFSCFCLGCSGSNQDRSTDKQDQEVIAVLDTFLAAVKDKDVSTAVSHLRDEAFSNQDDLIDFYTKSIATEKLLEYEIRPNVNFDKNGSANVNVNLEIQGQEEFNQSFTLRNIEGEWMLFFAK